MTQVPTMLIRTTVIQLQRRPVAAGPELQDQEHRQRDRHDQRRRQRQSESDGVTEEVRAVSPTVVARTLMITERRGRVGHPCSSGSGRHRRCGRVGHSVLSFRMGRTAMCGVGDAPTVENGAQDSTKNWTGRPCDVSWLFLGWCR